MKPTCAMCESGEVTVERVARPIADALPGVIVDGLERWTCAACGEVSEAWPHGGPLLELVFGLVLGKPSRLAPAEFRWLRERLGWRGNELAQHFGVSPEIVSKWERGKARISPQSDRLLRALVALRRGLPATAVRLDLDDDDAPLTAYLTFGPRGWRIREDATDASPPAADSSGA